MVAVLGGVCLLNSKTTFVTVNLSAFLQYILLNLIQKQLLLLLIQNTWFDEFGEEVFKNNFCYC